MKNNLLSATLLFGIALAANVSAAPPTSKKIVAGPVVATGSGITGSFKVVEDRSGIPSTGTGGACLVFSKHRRGGPSCKADSDCALAPEFTGGHGYCLLSKGFPSPSKQGKCWMRPAETPEAPYCRRSTSTPNPLDQDIGLPVDATGNLRPVAGAKPGWWRVHACLNGAAGACADSVNPDKMTHDGPPRRIP
ncbi:MAG: hypothetical protein ACREO7_12950 [Pseudoxanthomonas sp.]